jgi:hypothetical protein
VTEFATLSVRPSHLVVSLPPMFADEIRLPSLTIPFTLRQET